MGARLKLMIALAVAGTCLARADGPPAAAPAPPADAGVRSRWPGPIDGNRAPLLVLDLGVRLVACPGGTVEAAEIDISGLRYELGEACRDSAQRGHIEISGIAGQNTAGPQEKRPADGDPAGKSAPSKRPADPERKDVSAPRPITHCDPATWNCTPTQP